MLSNSLGACNVLAASRLLAVCCRAPKPVSAQSSPHITWGVPSSPHALHNEITTPHGHNHLNEHKRFGTMGRSWYVLIRFNSLSRSHAGYLNNLISTLLSGASTTNQSHFLSAHVPARFGICTCHRQSSLHFLSWRTMCSCFAPWPKYSCRYHYFITMLERVRVVLINSSRPHARPESGASRAFRYPPATYNAAISHPGPRTTRCPFMLITSKVRGSMLEIRSGDGNARQP